MCRNAPPTPFDRPQWVPDSVVGGARLGDSGVIADVAAGAAPPPEVYDVSYVVADLGSGEILAAKSPHAWLRPASTLKTLTALTLLPRLDPRTVVVAGEDAQKVAGSRVGVLAGNRYTVGNLVDAMLMFSANDAVYALADAAGGYDKTVALMNATARGDRSPRHARRRPERPRRGQPALERLRPRPHRPRCHAPTGLPSRGG